MTDLKINDMNDLREVILDQIKGLKSKETTPAVANAVFNGVGKVLSTVKMEIEYSRYIKKLEGALPLQIAEGKKKQADEAMILIRNRENLRANVIFRNTGGMRANIIFRNIEKMRATLNFRNTGCVRAIYCFRNSNAMRTN